MTSANRQLLITTAPAPMPSAGQLVAYIDGRKCRKRRSLMQAFGKALDFPSRTTNWDAFDDWMGLDWLAPDYHQAYIIVTDADELMAAMSDELPHAMYSFERSCAEADLPVTIELVCRTDAGARRLREALEEARRRWPSEHMRPHTDPAAGVQRIEARLGARLPDDYRSFLLAGLPWDDERRFLQWAPGDEWPSIVEVRKPYHFDEHRSPFKEGSVGSSTLEFMLDIFERRKPGDGVIPRDAIAVAGTETQEELLLFFRGERAGQMWLKDWRRLEAEDVDDPEAGLNFVAASFNAFLEMLSDDDPYE